MENFVRTEAGINDSKTIFDTILIKFIFIHYLRGWALADNLFGL